MSLFNSLNHQQLQALARCGTPEMAPLRELLTTTLGQAKDSLMKADTPMQLHRLQGVATVLNDLLLAIDKANKAK
jgi:hypothetical protein